MVVVVEMSCGADKVRSWSVVTDEEGPRLSEGCRKMLRCETPLRALTSQKNFVLLCIVFKWTLRDLLALT